MRPPRDIEEKQIRMHQSQVNTVKLSPIGDLMWPIYILFLVFNYYLSGFIIYLMIRVIDKDPSYYESFVNKPYIW